MRTFIKTKHAQPQRGQSLVELALTLTLILTLLAGAVDLGSAFFSYVAIRDAAQEGALYGSVSPYYDSNSNKKYDAGEPLNIGAIKSRVQSASSTPVDMYGPKVQIEVTTTDPTKPCSGSDHWVKVKVTYEYTLIMPLIGAIIGPTITLPASATDTILTPLCP